MQPAAAIFARERRILYLCPFAKSLISRALLFFTPSTPHDYLRPSSVFVRKLPQNGLVPKGPLRSTGGAGGIGRHDFNLKIDFASYRGRRRHPCHGPVPS